MKIHEATNMDWTAGMSYDERKAEFSKFRDKVEEILGYSLDQTNDGTNDKMPTAHPMLDPLRKAFLKGLEPDEAADFVESGEEPERFQNELSDEDLAGMGEYSADEEGDEYDFTQEPDFTDPRDEEDYTDYSMRQGEMGNPDRQR